MKNTLVGRDKKQSFIYLKERVWKKLQGWKEKLLSQAGREILIKSVIQAILTYTTSCFKLLLIIELEVLIRKFGRGIMETRGKCIWSNGRGFARLKKWAGWVLKKLKNSVKPF